LFGLDRNAGLYRRLKTFTATTKELLRRLLNVNYKVGDYGNLIVMGYWLDFTDPDVYFKSEPELWYSP